MKYNNEEDLKKDFIKYFGEEKWNAEKLMDKLWPDIINICNYMGIEPIPVVMDKVEADAKYIVKDNYIVISDRLVNDLNVVRKSMIRELRHYYQYICIKHKVGDNELRQFWIEDMGKDNTKVIDFDKLMLSYEIDANAFTKFFMKKLYNIDLINQDNWYDLILDLYVDKYLA